MIDILSNTFSASSCQSNRYHVDWPAAVKTRFAGFCLAAIAMVMSPVANAGSPVAMGPDLPGASVAKMEAYLLAPSVRISNETIGNHRTSTVSWYSDAGGIRTKTVSY